MYYLPFLTNEVSLLLISFLFLIFGVLIVSFAFVEVIKNFSNRFSFSKGFVGFTLLAVGTSLPELINAVTAGISGRMGDQTFAINSFYNIIGANTIQIIFLSFITFGFGLFALFKKDTKQFRLFLDSLFYQKMLIWALFLIEAIILLALLIFSDFFKIFEIKGFNPIPMIFLIVWLGYFSLAFKEEKETEINEEIPNKFQVLLNKLGNLNFLLFGLICWALFAGLSFLNFLVVSKFEQVLNIPNNISLGIILSLITSTPEFSAFFFLAKKKNYVLATSCCMGSTLFNFSLLFLTQIISGQWIFSENEFKAEVWKTTVLIWLLIFSLVFYFVFGYKNNEDNFHKSIIFSGGILFSFVITQIFISH